MKIIENFIEDKELFNSIKEILFGTDIPWYYCPTTGTSTDVSGFFFMHHLYYNNQFMSPYANSILLPILYRLSFKKLIRARINCYPKTLKIIYNEMHTDFDNEHKVALFSINTNDGFTFFENKKKIESVENRMLLFNGNLKHCSVAQRDTNLRINININYT